MGSTIRAFVGDTTAIDYILTKRNVDDDMSPAVDLSDAEVTFTMIDEDHSEPVADYTFDDFTEVDDYFDTNPDLLIRGLLICVNLLFYRYDGTGWSDDYAIVMNNIECELLEHVTGGVRFYPTAKEFGLAGMYPCYYSVSITGEGEGAVNTIEKYPKGEKLYIRIMDR